MHLTRKIAAAIASAALAAPIQTMLPGGGPDVVAAAEAELPGFQVRTVWSGLDFPTALAFASDGRVFVAERGGTIQAFSSVADTTPTEVVDLSSNVHAVGDRGLLGLATNPDFADKPFLYVAYILDAPPGGSAPFYDDTCPNFPEGCPATGRVSRIRVGADNRADGGEQVLIGGGGQPFWCHQQLGHALDHLAFGPDGALYISSGEGATGAVPGGDWGQQSTSGSARTPKNTCGDPPVPVGQALTLPTTEGGALRAQDLLTDGDPAQGSGAIVRVDPDTGDAMAGNPLIGVGDPSDDRHIVFGLRNPFRFTFRPGTREVWVADVGWNTWEEVNRIPNPTDATVENFGWPCYEGGSAGSEVNAVWANLDSNLCNELYDGQHGPVARPYWSFRHNSTPGSASCANAGSALSGIAFVDGNAFGAANDGALLVADYVKSCIWIIPRGANGLPDPAQVETLVSGAQALDLDFGADGAAYFVDLNGTVSRITFSANNEPPVARISADPPYGPTPLTVSFSAAGSTDDGGATGLSYAWDLDADGAFNDGSGVQISRTYTQAVNIEARVRVTDVHAASASASVTIRPGTTPPTARIVTPTTSTAWATGDVVPFSGTATDAEETLGASAMRWDVVLFHCQSDSDCHEHPHMSLMGSSGQFVAPEHAYPAHLELRLTVTDSRGLTDAETLRLDPRTVVLTFKTQPPGLNLTAGFETGPAPISVQSIVGSSVSVIAPVTQTVGSTIYTFDSWSDRGARIHDVVAGTSDRSVVARYRDGSQATPFVDVAGHIFEDDIAWAYDNGIVDGCSFDPPLFCPESTIRRGKMATFLVRAFDLPAATSDHFTDDNGSAHEGNINSLFEAGITRGCAPGRFCPTSPATRGQMASFLARALDLPAATSDHFTDDDGTAHEPSINSLFEAGITRGCGHGRFCPASAVTRGQMTALLHRAIGD